MESLRCLEHPGAGARGSLDRQLVFYRESLARMEAQRQRDLAVMVNHGALFWNGIQSERS